MLLQYKNDEGIPQIKDTEFVCPRSLLSKANNFSDTLTSLKQSLTNISRILKGFNIPIEETLSGINNLKQAMDVAARADNVKTNKQKVKPDIYFNSGNSNSQMEVQEVIDITTDTDSETSEVSVDIWGRRIEKEHKQAKGHPNSIFLLH